MPYILGEGSVALSSGVRRMGSRSDFGSQDFGSQDLKFSPDSSSGTIDLLWTGEVCRTSWPLVVG